jgi:hypothetical protein
MFRPGANTGYTRMLMFACLATIPMVFMLMMVGGKDRWIYLFAQAREWVHGGPLALMLVVGLGFLLVVMPLGMLVAIWFGMGLKFGSLFILYFVPVIMRLAFGATEASVLAAIVQGLTFFGSFLVGIGIVMVLQKLPSGVGTYETHLQVVWPDYSDAAKMFFSVCIFALISQGIEFRHAVMALVRSTHW